MTVYHFNQDQVFTKTIIKPGRGLNAPNEGSQCHIAVKLLSISEHINSDKTLYHDLLPFEQEIPIELGFYSSIFSHFVHRCLITMKRDEVSQLKFNIPDFEMSIELIVELRSFERAAEIYSMTMDHLYEFALKHKENANRFYKEKRYLQAFELYHRSLCYITNFINEEPCDEHEVYLEKSNELVLSIYSNMAACQLIYENHRAVIENCSSALKMNPVFVKALYRRGLAYFNLNDYELALKDLQSAHKLQPDDKNIEELLKKTKQSFDNYQKKMANSLKNLF